MASSIVERSLGATPPVLRQLKGDPYIDAWSEQELSTEGCPGIIHTKSKRHMGFAFLAFVSQLPARVSAKR